MAERRSPRGRRKKKKKSLKLVLLIFEFIILFVLVGVLYFVLKSDKIEKDETIEQTEAALRINDELGEMQEMASETGQVWNMSEYTTVALFARTQT